MRNWIHPPIIDTELFCDASDFAWAGVSHRRCLVWNWKGLPYKWDGITSHILYFEIIKFDLQGKHIKVFSDNTTAAAVTNKMGTCKNRALNKRARQICFFCQQFHIWITASHIPGKGNFEADFESRREYKDA